MGRASRVLCSVHCSPRNITYGFIWRIDRLSTVAHGSTAHLLLLLVYSGDVAKCVSRLSRLWAHTNNKYEWHVCKFMGNNISIESSECFDLWSDAKQKSGLCIFIWAAIRESIKQCCTICFHFSCARVSSIANSIRIFFLFSASSKCDCDKHRVEKRTWKFKSYMRTHSNDGSTAGMVVVVMIIFFSRVETKTETSAAY